MNPVGFQQKLNEVQTLVSQGNHERAIDKIKCLAEDDIDFVISTCFSQQMIDQYALRANGNNNNFHYDRVLNAVTFNLSDVALGSVLGLIASYNISEEDKQIFANGACSMNEFRQHPLRHDQGFQDRFFFNRFQL